MTRSASKASLTPRPSQVGQAPKGLLNENSRGSISLMVKPETGQANFSEKTMRRGSSPSGAPDEGEAHSAVAMPSARFRAVWMLSA
ncbi:hypothetical protein D3C87_944550 [compost metagenome]